MTPSQHSPPPRRSWWKIALASLTLGAAGGVFLAFGPPHLLAKTETPEFCASCHVMESQYEAWFHTGAHRTIQCVDCHLPHQNKLTYYTWKGIDGMKDVYVFNMGKVPEIIEISEHGQKFVQDNCIRCHSARVEMIDQNRPCWDCHRMLQHKRAGARETF